MSKSGCRDCADNDGTCPNDGLPCDRHVGTKPEADPINGDLLRKPVTRKIIKPKPGRDLHKAVTREVGIRATENARKRQETNETMVRLANERARYKHVLDEALYRLGLGKKDRDAVIELVRTGHIKKAIDHIDINRA
jgi:hypothetical protein